MRRFEVITPRFSLPREDSRGSFSASGTATDVTWDFPMNNGTRALFEGTNALGTVGRIVPRSANTYTGSTTINTGTLRHGTGGSIASSGTISVGSGTVFDTNVGFSLAPAQWLQGSGTVLGSVTTEGTISPGVSGSAAPSRSPATLASTRAPS